MIIENLAKLCDWATAAAREFGVDPACAEAAAGAIWRHAHGQGLRAGDDWGWILEQYGREQFREIAAAAARPGRGR
jgi:hypothetical protein